jgi:hypothetical protein
MSITTKEIALTPIEIRQIFRLENARSTPLWAFTVGCLLTVLAVTAYGYYLRQDFAVLDAWIPFLGCVALWWVFVLGIAPWFVARSEGLKRLMSPTRFNFSEHTLRQESEDGAIKEVPLASLARVKIREKYIILYDRDNAVIVVANRAFQSPEEAQQVRALLGAPNPLLQRTPVSGRR